jgi:hypothetical protein
MKEFPSEMILKYPRSGYLNSAFCILNFALCRLGGTTNYNSPIYDHYIISRGFVKESGVFLEIRGFSLDLQGK